MHKTIFGTTEKSNFILNMKDETIEKLPIIFVKILTITMLIGQAIPELIEVICILTNNGYGKSYGFLNTPFMSLAIVWVVSIIMLVIMGARNRFNKKYHKVLVSLILIELVWSIISTTQSFSILDSINGLYGRTTGLLTLISCMCILLLMSFNTLETNLKDIVKFLVITSVVQCGWGLIQILSSFSETSLFFYDNLNNISLYGVCLPSGFSGSPIFFAEYLCLMLGITLTLACTEKSRFYTIMSIVYTFLILDTHTIVGLIGTITILLAIFILMIVKKYKNILPIILCVVMSGITLGVSFALDGSYILYDGAIMWQDSFYRLGTTGYYNSSSADFDINSITSVLSYIWSNVINYIKIFPIVGTGMDCLIYTQLGPTESISQIVNGFDLVYNDYLQIAVNMGIPALILYIVSIIYCLIKVSKRLNDSNIFKGLLISIIAFITMSFVCSTTITIMPYICVILGLACSKNFTSIKDTNNTTNN